MPPKKVKIKKLPWWAFKARRWKTETIKRNIFRDEIIVRMQLDGYDIKVGRSGKTLYFVPRPPLKRLKPEAVGIVWTHPSNKEHNISRFNQRSLGVQTQWWTPPKDRADLIEIHRRAQLINIFEILRYYRAQLGWLQRYSGWLPDAIASLVGEAD